MPDLGRIFPCLRCAALEDRQVTAEEKQMVAEVLILCEKEAAGKWTSGDVQRAAVILPEVKRILTRVNSANSFLGLMKMFDEEQEPDQ